MSSAPQPSGAASHAGPQPINEAQRRRLQSWFTHGAEKAAAGNHDYAGDLFIQCVKGDPGSLDYQRAFLQNLYKKYKNNKKGASFGGLQGGNHKSTLKKSLASKDWKTALDSGLELLRINPWDTGVLVQIAQAAGELQCYDVQLGYLKAALDSAPKDVEVCRSCAKALAYLGDFNQAITMWHKVEELRPGDTDAPREISNLQRDKIFGVPPKRPASAGPPAAAKNHPAPQTETAPVTTSDHPAIKLTQTQLMQKEIKENPLEVEHYFALAEHYANESKFADAEQTLRTALEMSGRDLNVQEKIEDLGLKRGRHQVQIAEQRAVKDPTDAAKELAKRMKTELNSQELEIYRARSERYPQVGRWKYELGVRVKKSGNYHEAAKLLEEAQHDPLCRPQALLEWGESLQYMKQYQPALDRYQEALAAIPEKAVELRKLALYRAGVLASGLKDYELAEKHLSTLAVLDFHYKDVGERLDKLNNIHHK